MFGNEAFGVPVGIRYTFLQSIAVGTNWHGAVQPDLEGLAEDVVLVNDAASSFGMD